MYKTSGMECGKNQAKRASSEFSGVLEEKLFWLFFFPNSHAMGSCKTNRRTGAVGSPSELVGGWCPGHVLMASGSCDAGVPVSRSCFDCDPIML